MIDTHCHLYALEFEADREAILDAAKQEGVERIFLPAIDRSSHHMMMELATNAEGYCLPMMGLHPCSVGVNFENELEEVESWLERDRFYAIGEIGLDFYHSTEWKLQQVEAFAFQIQLAKRYALPIVIHSRSSMDECIQTIAQEHDTDLKGIFHCFGGDLRQANIITEMGWMLGIGGVLTYKNAGLAKILEEISLENIVLETDAPYLSPVPFRGKRNEPSYIKYIAQKVADIKNISVQEVEALTNANAKKIFSF